MDSRWAGQEAELNRKLREIAGANDGVLSVGDLIRRGMTEKMIQTRKRNGRLIPVLRGVVTLPGTRLTEKGWWRASVWSSGRNACLSHGSALALHGVVRASGAVRVTRSSGPGSRTKTSEEFGFSVRIHQTRWLPREQVDVIEDIPATSVERSIVDFASVATRQEIGHVLSQAERERKLCWRTLGELVEQSNGRKGLGRLRSEIEFWDPSFVGARSNPEEDFLRMIKRGEVPMPMVNFPLGGYVVDFIWMDLKLVVELDPYGTHEGYASFHGDRRKSVELEKRGYRVIRFTWRDLYFHEERTLSELKRILEQQHSAGGATSFRP